MIGIDRASQSAAPHPQPKTRAGWPAPAAGLLALALYARTLAPGLTWAHNGADGGDFLAAALTGGAPHPPGYPTYQLLLRAAIALFPGEPARAGNWLSALCAAMATALLADLARRSLTGRRWRGFIALVAALAWAASPMLWGQAVITEVYTPNALFAVALLWLAWRWRESLDDGRPRRWLIGAGFILGLGLGNHLSLALMLPGLAVWAWSNRRAKTNKNGTRTSADERGRILSGVSAFIRVHLRSDLKTVALALAALALGLSVYAYLPLAAASQPPVNWGDPRSLSGFWWLVSGRVYGRLVFGVGLPYLPGRLAAWVAEALRQFGGPWSALIALVGLWQIDRRDHAWWRLTGLVALAYSLYAVGYNTADSYVYLIPVWAVAALWLAEGLAWGFRILRLGPSMNSGGASGQVSDFGFRNTLHAPRSTFYVLRALLLAALIALPAISVGRFWGESDLHNDHAAQDFVAAALSAAEPDAVILTATDEPTFALWYARYGLGLRPDLTPINVNLYVYPWYQATLATTHPFLVAISGDSDLPTLDRLVAAVAAERPLYRAEPLNLIFAGFVEKPAGVLVRMTPR